MSLEDKESLQNAPHTLADRAASAVEAYRKGMSAIRSSAPARLGTVCCGFLPDGDPSRRQSNSVGQAVPETEIDIQMAIAWGQDPGWSRGDSDQ